MLGLRLRGMEFESHAPELPGRPDIVFRQQRIVVFIDGDFWHGWRFPLWRHKLANLWQEKISATRERDKRNFSKLRRQGWKVIRLWEHQIETDPERCIDKILAAMKQSQHAYKPSGKRAEGAGVS